MTQHLEFDCATSEPIDVVATMISDASDPEQMVCITHITAEGLMFDFFIDGELIRTMGKTWEEWYESSPRAL